MSVYDDFEKRFTSSWFASGWVEVQPHASIKLERAPEREPEHCRKGLQELQDELNALKTDVENISFKQIRLANLAKFYQ